MKKKILLLVMSAVLLTGCVSQQSTVTIDKKANATIEKKFSYGSTYASDELSKKAAEYFLNGVKAQNPVSLQKYKTDEDMGYIAILKPGNAIDNDVLAIESFFKPNEGTKNINCQKEKKVVSCKADFNINLKNKDLEKLLDENGLTYDDLEPYVLIMKLPNQAVSHNANFFDLEKNTYVWEIPAGGQADVKINFNI